MLVSEINPFVRFAGFIPAPSTPLRIARDNRLFFVMADHVTWNIQGKTHVAPVGTALFIPSGTSYSLSSSEHSQLIGVNFDFTQIASHISTSIATLAPELFDAGSSLEHLPFEDACFAAPILLHGAISEQKVEHLVSEFQQKKIFFREKSSAILKEILMDILRFSRTDSTKERSCADAMIAYKQENYMLPITNREIAAYVRYHEYHANRLMLRHTGTTMHKYLTNYRIERAKTYLTATELSVSEIAERTGLGSVSRFSACFKNATGLSPAAYRTQNFRLV